MEAALKGVPGATFGVGLDHSIVSASVQAVVAVANRLIARRGTKADTAQAAPATA